jgi:hypothetical protein
MAAQAKVQEAGAKAQADGQAPAGPQSPTIEDQIKMADLQLKQQELRDKQQDNMMDAINRKRDRESRERLAAVKLAEDLAANPQGVPIANSILDPGMIQRLEANEQPLTE